MTGSTAAASAETRGPGRNVVITGANRGLGRRTAEVMADQGWRVFVGSRHREAGEQVAAALRARGGDAVCVTLDVTDPDSVKAAVDTIGETADRIDALVNNAGVYTHNDQHIPGFDVEVCVQLLRVNSVGPLLMIQALQPLLRMAEASSVVNLTSDDARPDRAGGEYISYCMSKAAVNNLTVNAAVALRQDNILVNAVEPGWIPTDMGGADAPDDIDAAARLVAWAAALPGSAPDAPTGQVFSMEEPPEGATLLPFGGETPGTRP